MLHHVPDFIRRASKKPAIIVIDGMSFADWQLFGGLLKVLLLAYPVSFDFLRDGSGISVQVVTDLFEG
jgi:hypothetical protein